ncbi:hypothetical protein [Massilia sp. TS11]|uniref:hypothetical protein n=1 Tax=Massilia sp. TS11 TaxID=2908003 RepID=UPI001EDB5C3E|nr:hypothetical protein [Massilia sp. TS11]MCG2586304.1 hypothetical protein [Massilia sp. TS11]
MPRFQSVCGYAAALILLLSSVAHSLAGWPAMREQLLRSGAQPELIQGLHMAWQFGGMVMLVLALVVFLVLRAQASGRGAPAQILPIIGAGYAAFGLAEFALTQAGFTFVFTVPGLLLLAAAWPRRS